MKKPLKKSPAKKAATKIKLIEGQYSHKFLTRLRPDIGKKLEAIKIDVREKTLNGCIVKIITQHSVLKKELEECRSKLKETEETSNVALYLISAVQKTINELKDFGKNKGTIKTILKKCPVCEEFLNPDGYCNNIRDSDH